MNGPIDWISQRRKKAGPTPRMVSPCPTIRLSVRYTEPRRLSASPDPLMFILVTMFFEPEMSRASAWPTSELFRLKLISSIPVESYAENAQRRDGPGMGGLNALLLP